LQDVAVELEPRTLWRTLFGPVSIISSECSPALHDNRRLRAASKAATAGEHLAMRAFEVQD
jgi:hypothetical protein